MYQVIHHVGQPQLQQFEKRSYRIDSNAHRFDHLQWHKAGPFTLSFNAEHSLKSNPATSNVWSSPWNAQYDL